MPETMPGDYVYMGKNVQDSVLVDLGKERHFQIQNGTKYIEPQTENDISGCFF